MRLWFDTNTLWRRPSEQRELTELARSRGFSPVVSAQVYLEDRRQTRVRSAALGRPFDERVNDALFSQLYEVIDVPLDRATAARWADRLAVRYPGPDAWKQAKRATLGGKLRDAFEVLPAHLPMTTDWLIALAVEDDAQSRIVTEEGGEEWSFLRSEGRVMSWKESLAWLASMAERG